MSCGMYVTCTVSPTPTGVFMTCKPDSHHDEILPARYHDLVSTQTGALLVALGQMMTHSPALKDYIAPQTGEMLVKIGKKLTGNAG